MRQITPVELIVTYISIGWAIAMFANPNIFGHLESFDMVHKVFNEQWILGSIAAVSALIKLIGIFTKKTKIRWLGLMISSVLWIVITACFLVNDGSISITTGVIAYSGIAFLSLMTSKEVMTYGRTVQSRTR